jgi:hypothetical protein
VSPLNQWEGGEAIAILPSITALCARAQKKGLVGGGARLHMQLLSA